MEIIVYELKTKIYLLEDIPYQKIQSVLSSYMDRCLGQSKEFLEFHKEKKYKNYVFSNPFPLEKDGIYKEGKVYTITIRTVAKELADYLNKELPVIYTNWVKGLTCEKRILPRKILEKVYTITPVVLKNNEGYWRKCVSIEEFEKRLKENLIKKFEIYTGEKVDRDLLFYRQLEFLNRKPIAMEYKDVRLLGDKVSLIIEDNQQAQDIFYFAIGAGMLENNSRGYGFCNYRWL